MGAYLSTFSTAVPTYLYATLLAGQYTSPAIYGEVDGVMRHRPGRCLSRRRPPEATYVVEIVEEAARHRSSTRSLSAGRISLPLPHQTPVIMAYDAGDYDAGMREALELADYSGFAPARPRGEGAREARGRLLGLHRSLRHRPERRGRPLGAGVGRGNRPKSG